MAIQTMPAMDITASDLVVARAAIDKKVAGATTINSRGEPRSRVSLYRKGAQIILIFKGAAGVDKDIVALVKDLVNEARGKGKKK